MTAEKEFVGFVELDKKMPSMTKWARVLFHPHLNPLPSRERRLLRFARNDRREVAMTEGEMQWQRRKCNAGVLQLIQTRILFLLPLVRQNDSFHKFWNRKGQILFL